MDMGLADSFQDVDDVISYGFGRRLAYTANFKRLDLIGLDFLYTTLTESGKPVWGRLVEKVRRGELGMKSGKGFYEWSDEAAARESRRLKEGLLQLMKQDMEAGNI
jgi:3-hydroxybutyryl-CoA dehydrogenase